MNINNAPPITANRAPQQLTDAMQVQLAEGIMGQFLDPLNAGKLAFAILPEMAFPAVGVPGERGPWMPPIIDLPPTPRPEPVQDWNVKTNGPGRATVDLGDGYILKFNERNSEIEIFNTKTNEHTRIWGDPHVDVDGKRVFDFWGTTTFTLENGTKITINTEPWNGNVNAYVASQVVITKGSNALVVDGISQNKLGDLSMTMSENGYAIDAEHRDGYVLHENATGSSWRSEHTFEVATQADLMATAIGREYGPGSEAASLSEAIAEIGSFIMFGPTLNLPVIRPFDTTQASEQGSERTADRPVDRAPAIR
jgi:hypothetical protein